MAGKTAWSGRDACPRCGAGAGEQCFGIRKGEKVNIKSPHPMRPWKTTKVIPPCMAQSKIRGIIYFCAEDKGHRTPIHQTKDRKVFWPV
jgi:hypothetical protein